MRVRCKQGCFVVFFDGFFAKMYFACDALFRATDELSDNSLFLKAVSHIAIATNRSVLFKGFVRC